MRAVLLLFLASPIFAQSTFDLQGYVAARGADSDTRRLPAGERFSGVTQLGFEWNPSEHFGVHVSGAGDDDRIGFVEAFADARAIVRGNEVRLRAGQFFLPSSRENKGELWTSPYAISFSALNTWIAEEVRPIGVDLQWRRTLGGGGIFTAAATAFQGNDSMGAILGWRGWWIGSRLTRYDEVLPLPPLPQLKTFFADQRDDGTKPFGRDLDDRAGYSARVRYSRPERWNVQYLYLDNDGDRMLHRGEYAWKTRFHLVSAEAGNSDRLVIAGEYMTGDTGMGVAPAFVQADFYAAYVLVSAKRARNRVTARYERFGTEERDFSPAGRNDESGRAWTLAWLFDVTNAIRAGAEYTQIRGNRPAAPVRMDGRALTLEARYRF